VKQSGLMIAIPVVTGLLSAMWSRIIEQSYVLNGIVWFVSGIAIVGFLLTTGHKWPTTIVFSWPVMAAYIALNVLLTWMWMEVASATAGTDPTPVALVEIAWPVFTALFMWWLYDRFTLTPTQIVGGGISIIGAVVVIIGRA
jgi:drug/metabolite transporter (DMT)-like permease